MKQLNVRQAEVLVVLDLVGSHIIWDRGSTTIG